MNVETLHQNPAPPPELRPNDVDAGEWDAFVAGQPNGHLLQTSAWAEFKSQAGWQAERVVVGTAAGPLVGALILYRRLPLGPILAYIPKGPVGLWQEPAMAGPLFKAIHERAGRRRAFMLKIEPEERDGSPAITALQQVGFRPSSQTACHGS